MFLLWIPLLFAFGFVQALADLDLDIDPDLLQRTLGLDLNELQVLNKLLSGNDTSLSHETKMQLAQYLVAQALEAEKNRLQTLVDSSTIQPKEEIPATTSEPTTTSLPSTTTQAQTTTQRTTTRPAPAAETTTTQRPRSTPSPDHVLNQVDKILQNVGSGNVIGIVDESLAINSPQPVRNLVNGILTTVFCNPIDRLFSRCRRPAAASAPNRIG